MTTLGVVQSKFVSIGSGSGPFTITFTSPLTTGNTVYLFVYGQFFNGSFPAAAWTLESTNGAGGSTNTQYLLSRVVQVSDGATPPAIMTSTNATFRIIGIEISGGPPLVEAIVKNTSTSAPITGPTTANNNDLGLLASGGGAGFGAYTAAAGWTNDQNDTGGSTTLDHIAVPTSGTSLTASPSWSVNGTSGHWMSVALKINAATNVSLTGVSATAAVGTLATDFDGSVTLTGVAAIGTPGSLATNHNSSFNLVGVSTTAAARQITNTGGFNLVGVSAVAHAGAFVYENIHLQGVQTYAAALPIGLEIAPPVCPFPVFSIMRDTPVACSGAMDDGPVLGIGALCVSEPEPYSIAFHLTGVACGSRAATITPFFNVNSGLLGVSATCLAGTVFGIGNVP